MFTLETIRVNNTYSRFVFQNSDFDYDYLSTGYLKYKNMRKSLLRLENTVKLSGKNIEQAYLFISGKLRVCNSNFIPREVFVHRIEDNYGKIVKWTEICAYKPGLYSSIMVGETYKKSYSWDITSLFKSWINILIQIMDYFLNRTILLEKKALKNIIYQ